MNDSRLSLSGAQYCIAAKQKGRRTPCLIHLLFRKDNHSEQNSNPAAFGLLYTSTITDIASLSMTNHSQQLQPCEVTSNIPPYKACF
ncbi:hypothetical protein [Photorhabdus aegyptia]|uniref:hypothetical protein n=1 Tax=Photorhabdus aegyptia TaxID=2805098 RepID=UPI00126892CA|nr:hypothetical protein [Photorhabdus aegyptia]